MSQAEAGPATPNAGSHRELPKNSMWRLPGLDKDSFYAAALYLHVAIGEMEIKPMIRPPNTPEKTRDFLDRLADCFARSKERDARDHVSATSMSRDNEQKRITLYIAKNQSYKRMDAAAVNAEVAEKNENENEIFAKRLVNWFTTLAAEGNRFNINEGLKRYWGEFETMCEFSQSRLEHYTEKIGELSLRSSDFDHLVESHINESAKLGWEKARKVIKACQEYPLRSKNFLSLRQLCDNDLQGLDMDATVSKSRPTSKADLTYHAELAGQTRKDENFHALRNELSTATGPKRPRLQDLAKAVQGVEYLGRHYAAFVKFMEFCTDEKQKGFTFDFYLLPSQEEQFDGAAYLQKFDSWIGEFDIKTEYGIEEVRPKMQDIVFTGHSARVHCEMSLLMLSVERDVKFLDYIGGSKKSCWLCWRVLKQANIFSVKGSHYKLFPHWAFPFDFSPEKIGPADGLRGAYEDMKSAVQAKAILRQPLVSAGQHLQSSARFTPFHLLKQMSNISKLDSGLFSAGVIEAKDRLPLVQIPALHFPAGPSSPDEVRRVKVSMYACTSVALEQVISPLYFAGEKVIPAFALITLDHIPNWAEEGLNAGMQAFWEFNTFFESYKSTSYVLFSRSDLAGMKPNPYLQKITNDASSTEMTRELHPWRGDVFVFQLSKESRGKSNVKEIGNFEPDEKRCLEALKQYVARHTLNELEEIARETYKRAENRLESKLMFDKLRKMKIL